MTFHSEAQRGATFWGTIRKNLAQMAFKPLPGKGLRQVPQNVDKIQNVAPLSKEGRKREPTLKPVFNHQIEDGIPFFFKIPIESVGLGARTTRTGSNLSELRKETIPISPDNLTNDGPQPTDDMLP